MQSNENTTYSSNLQYALIDWSVVEYIDGGESVDVVNQTTNVTMGRFLYQQQQKIFYLPFEKNAQVNKKAQVRSIEINKAKKYLWLKVSQTSKQHIGKNSISGFDFTIKLKSIVEILNNYVNMQPNKSNCCRVIYAKVKFSGQLLSTDRPIFYFYDLAFMKDYSQEIMNQLENLGVPVLLK